MRKYGKYGRVRRKSVNAFLTEDTNDYSHSICNSCYDSLDVEINLIPYIMDNGKPDNHFLRCPHCSSIIPKRVMKFTSEVHPLGKIEGEDNATFTVVHSRRKTRTAKAYEPYSIPELSEGIPDRDLEALLHDRVGIVTNLVDAVIQEDGEDSDGTVIVERFY